MRLSKILLALLIFSFSLSAQDSLSKISFKGLSFRELGPALTSGRVADIAVNPKNHNEYYVAAASGGVWKTANHGISFKPIFDGEGSYSIGCITIDPNNEKTIWVGSGENNNQRSVAYGDGIYRSLDGGKSWKNMGLKESEHIGMIKVHPKKSNIVYVAAYGPLWSKGGDRGIFKTEDGGKNWENILEVSEHTGFNEIHFDPRNPQIIYATAHQRRRHVWTYVSGGPESNIYKSEDGGENWKKLSSGLPNEKGRIGLAIPPSNPNIIYAMIEGHGVYKSENQGATFKKLNDYNSSGNYYVELVPHPTDENVVYSLDTYLHITKDGGNTWERVKSKNRHVDDHCLWINPKNPNQMIIGCDGGLYETYTAGGDWLYKPNLPITQFYRVAVDNSEPFYYVYGGTQDNFSLGGPNQTINNRGIVNSDWFVTNTGDGFESQIDPLNPNIVYAQAQYGWLVRYDKASGESVGIKPSPDKGEKAHRWNWDAPLLISPHNNKRLYFAANKLFRSDDRGDNWESISPDLSQQIDRHTLPVMDKIQSVDAISYDRSTSNYGNIVALDESPLKEGLIYVGTDDGLIQVTDNAGNNWTKIENFPGIPKNTYVNQVLASLYDESTVYAVFNNHKNGDFKPYILKSTDRGNTWQNISKNLPEKGSVYCIKQDHVNKDLMFAGTEYGLFFTLNGGKDWIQLKNGLPTIAIRDMDIQKRENDLVLASFGRGFYVLDDYSPLRELSDEIAEKDFHLFEIPDAIVFMEASPLGYGSAGFMGSTYYMAPNPEQGACFSLYINKLEKSKKAKRKAAEKKARKNDLSITYPNLDELRAEAEEEKQYLLFIIKDAKGNEIRRFTKSPSAGLNRYYWDGERSGYSSVRTKGEPETGSLAAPGEYSVDIFLNNNGRLQSILDKPKSFTLNWLNNNSFKAENYEALIAFQDSLELVRRDFNGLSSLYKKLNEKTEKMKAVAKNTPGTPLSLLNDFNEIQDDLKAIKLRLYGDDIRAKHYFETTPSLRERLGDATWNSYSTTSGTTGEQRKNVTIVIEANKELSKQLNSIEDRLEGFYKILLNNGAPYIDGDLD